MFKTSFLQIEETTVYSAQRYLLNEHNAKLTLRSIGAIVSEIWQNVLNLIFENWRNNSLFGAALPAEHNALTLRSIGPIVSEIWQNV